jgi:hypothetical protein
MLFACWIYSHGFVSSLFSPTNQVWFSEFFCLSFSRHTSFCFPTHAANSGTIWCNTSPISVPQVWTPLWLNTAPSVIRCLLQGISRIPELNTWSTSSSSGMLRRVILVRTDVSEECSIPIIRVITIGNLGTGLAGTSNRSTLRSWVASYC